MVVQAAIMGAVDLFGPRLGRRQGGAEMGAPGWLSLAGADWVEQTTNREKMWMEFGK